MDLSIIVPVHNLENYIFPLLLSLRLQVFNSDEVEIIFICDSCTDNSEKIIRNFKLNNYEVTILTVDYKSAGLARNAGLNIAKGDIVWFMDGDDYLIDPLAINKVIEFFVNNPDSNLLRFKFEYPSYFEYPNHISMLWQWAIRRDLIGDLRFKDIHPNEDFDFMCEIIKKSKQYTVARDKLYYYNYLRPGSTMRQFFTEKYGELDWKKITLCT